MKEWLVVRRPLPVRGDVLEGPELIAMSPTATRRDDSRSVGTEQADGRDQLPNKQEIDTAAEPMPMSLIKPYELEAESKEAQAILLEAKGAGAAWGLRALGVDPKKFDG